MEGSRSGSVQNNDKSGSGSGRPENIRIRIHNTGLWSAMWAIEDRYPGSHRIIYWNSNLDTIYTSRRCLILYLLLLYIFKSRPHSCIKINKLTQYPGIFWLLCRLDESDLFPFHNFREEKFKSWAKSSREINSMPSNILPSPIFQRN